MDDWERRLDEIARLARELYRYGHNHDGEFAVELAGVGADILNAVSDAQMRIPLALKRDARK